MSLSLSRPARYLELMGDLDDLRRQADTTGPMQQRTFRIQISKYEFCSPKAEAELDGYTVYVYTPSMIAIEKLRAICQQMDEYPYRGRKTARARDFYDIHSILRSGTVDLNAAENRELLAAIFAAKEVPIRLLALIPNYRAFHRQDWPSVEESVSRDLRDYDFYFDFVLGVVEDLESLRIE